MIATVFVGPSISVSEGRGILPNAIFRPPAEQGDLLSAVSEDGAEIVGLIDGTFHQNLSVWHSEVCYLLSRGITIYGASSMGALRAVETERFGMVGIGRVFGWYREGAITGDDEVALVHGDESSNFQNISVPLVNIRASIEKANLKGSLQESTGNRVVEIAKSLYYPERRVHLIMQLCRESGFSDNDVRAAQDALTTGYVDVKREDARELLFTVASVLNGSFERPKPVQFEFMRSSVFDTLYNFDRKLRVEGTDVSLQQIGEHVALHCPEYRKIRRAGLNRTLVVYLGLLLGVSVDSADIAAERDALWDEQNIDSADAFQAWLRANALNEADFWQLMAQEAICQRLARSGLTLRSFDRGCRAVLDELRVRGTFLHWAKETAEEVAIVSAYGERPEYRAVIAEHPSVLANEHASRCNVKIKGDARKWAADAGFDGVQGLVDALRRAVIFHDVRCRIAQQVKAVEKAIADATALPITRQPPKPKRQRTAPTRFPSSS
jgi:hypothetical protein